MPVEMIAAFVAEEALGIAAGAAAAAAAPIVIPKLKALGQDAVNDMLILAGKAQQAGSRVVESTRQTGSSVRTTAQSVAAIPAALTAPITKTGHIIDGKISGAADWYSEQWSDLLAEVQGKRKARWADSMTLAGILASLAEAPVVSDIPGRARLRLVYLKGRTDRSVFIADIVATVPGVLRVGASPHTSSVLIHYDTMQYASLDSLLYWIVAR